MEITKTNGVIYFKEGESTVAIPQSILQTATIEKSGGGVNIIYSKGGKDTELNILYANVTTPVVTSSDSLISELYSLIGQPLEATVLYGTPVNAVATQRVYTPSTIVAGDTVTVGDKVYTFVDQLSDPAVEGEVLVGVSLTYLYDAINANMNSYGLTHSLSEANVYFIATAKDATTLTVTAKVKGIAGNSLVVDTDNGDWDTTPTVEGVDGTVGDINTIYQDENYIYTTLGNTISGANWNKVSKNNQELSINGQNLSITGGNTVTLPSGSEFIGQNGSTIANGTYSGDATLLSGSNVFEIDYVTSSGVGGVLLSSLSQPPVLGKDIYIANTSGQTIKVYGGISNIIYGGYNSSSPSINVATGKVYKFTYITLSKYIYQVII